MTGFIVLGLKQRKKNKNLRYLHEEYTAYEYSVKSDDSGDSGVLSGRQTDEFYVSIREVETPVYEIRNHSRPFLSHLHSLPHPQVRTKPSVNVSFKENPSLNTNRAAGSVVVDSMTDTGMSSHLMEIDGGMMQNRDDFGVEMSDMPPMDPDADAIVVSSGILNLDLAITKSGDESMDMRSQYTAEERRKKWVRN